MTESAQQPTKQGRIQVKAKELEIYSNNIK
jgi:hypothetical protein